jgi:hypothetical protein
MIVISDRTASILRRWLSKRDNYERYRGTDALWFS